MYQYVCQRCSENGYYTKDSCQIDQDCCMAWDKISVCKVAAIQHGILLLQRQTDMICVHDPMFKNQSL